jgi:tetratricopeptide (TPR) repeat protein
VRDFRHALVDDPTNGAYVMLLGQALFASGQYDEAAGATQQATTMLPQDKWGTVISNYKELYPNIGDYTTQLRALEKARDEKPDDPALRFLLGWHYGYLGYPKQAVRELNKTLELAPKDEVAKKVRDAMAEKLPKSELPPAEKPAPPDVKGTET